MKYEMEVMVFELFRILINTPWGTCWKKLFIQKKVQQNWIFVLVPDALPAANGKQNMDLHMPFCSISRFTIIKEITPPATAADIKVNTADSSLNC